jgi:dolichol kinase
MTIAPEIKRKAFHLLTGVYVLTYWVLPRWLCLSILGVALLFVGGGEWIRLRRPEINAWCLKKFSGLHRESEIMNYSGVFWTLLGSWLTMVIFTSKRIVLPALGFLVFGDAVAALGGQKWGKHHWKFNPSKSIEGSACFALVSVVWALFFVRWPVAILGAISGAWIEARAWPPNDGLWLPVLGGAVLSVLNLLLGRR